MKKIVRFYLRITTELHDQLKKEANEKDRLLADLCREKLKGNSHLDRLESAVHKIETILLK